MDCNKIAIMLSAYIDSELNKEEVEILNEHLGICSKCKERFERMKNINKNLSYEEEFKLSPFFETRLFNCIRQDKTEELSIIDFIKTGKRVIYAGLAFSFVLIVFVTLTNNSPTYKYINDYVLNNGSYPISKHLAAKHDITNDDIVSIVFNGK